jgi:hypothetical protein
MNIIKNIELLRFYVTDKIDQMHYSVQDSLSNEIEDILSSILSAIFSMFLSSELIKTNGIGATAIRIALVIALYFLLKCIFKKWRRYCKSNKEQKAADERRISRNEAKALIDKFDHIACDGILLSRDYYQKYSSTDDTNLSEKLFNLFEAFYYYKKALQITYLVTEYPADCFNCVNNISGISKYRFCNIVNSLEEIQKEISYSIDNQKGIDYRKELKNEMFSTLEIFNKILNFKESFNH